MAVCSIIIPVCNAAPYLRECLDSVLAQTCVDWEAICVDDGSTDGSGAILDEYAAKDARIKVIHQSNAGVSAARNAGLAVSRGEWVSFVDSDDRIEANYLRAFLDWQEKGDVNFFNMRSFGEGLKTDADIEALGCSSVAGNAVKLYKRAFNAAGVDAFGWTWNKFIRGDLARAIRFDKAVCYFEDEIYALEVCDRAETFSFMPDKLYWYRVRVASLTRQASRYNRSSALAFGALIKRLHNDELRKLAKVRMGWLWRDEADSTGSIGAYLRYLKSIPGFTLRSVAGFALWWMRHSRLFAGVRRLYRRVRKTGEFSRGAA